MINIRRFLYLSLASLALFGCSKNNDATPNTDGTAPTDVPATFGVRHDIPLSKYETVATNQAPFNTSDYPDFTPVVFIDADHGEASGTCTGTLIGSQWVLSAGHCFFDPAKDTAPTSIDKLSILVGADPNSPIETRKVSALYIAPSWLDGGDFYKYGNDIALIKLASPITSITPAAVNFTMDAETIGSTVWYAGYGDYSAQAGQDASKRSKKHALENILDRRMGGLTHVISGINYEGGTLAFDFDDPSGIINTLGDSYANDQEKALGSGTSTNKALDWEATTVQGDSGGPLLMKINFKWTVIGVLNGGVTEPLVGLKDGAYGDISTFTRTASFRTWIQETMKK